MLSTSDGSPAFFSVVAADPNAYTTPHRKQCSGDVGSTGRSGSPRATGGLLGAVGNACVGGAFEAKYDGLGGNGGGFEGGDSLICFYLFHFSPNQFW